jgi:hypothetical protein
MSERLVDKLQAFNESLTEAERANYKLLLGLAAGGLSPDFRTPSRPEKRAAFDTVGETLARLQPYSARISPNGIAYRGRPDFMTDEVLRSLIEEAEVLRPRAIPYEEHFLGTGAPIANRMAVSAELGGLVKAHAGDVQPTGVASFLFYDAPGQGIEPHIDTDIFSLNVILMLKHVGGGDQRSCLVVFPPGREPERLDLVPGEMVIMFAGSITHGREFVKPDEEVAILTFGFHPLGI